MGALIGLSAETKQKRSERVGGLRFDRLNSSNQKQNHEIPVHYEEMN
jgi:hypothetical protein